MKNTISRLLTLQDLELQTPNKRTSEAENLRAGIPPVMLDRFDKFLVRGKKGVAVVRNGVCRGCQIALPVGVFNGLIQGELAQICDSCGRYLYLPEAEAADFRAGTRADTIVVKVKVPMLSTKNISSSVKTTRARKTKKIANPA